MPAADKIDSICHDFERGLESAEPPPIEAYLERIPQSQQGHLLRELLLLEWDSMDRYGDGLSLKTYLDRFSNYKQVVQEAWAKFTSRSRHLAETIDYTPDESSITRRTSLPTTGDCFGPFQLQQVLGQGGMGTVYEAVESESGRRVAVKVLKHSLGSPVARKRFLREGQLAASVNHPNSVYVFGTYDIDGTPAISTELVNSGTLQERVQREGPLPIGDAVDAVLQIIDGLEAAQNVGVLHRDIKPSNCFVSDDGTVKVGDFGLSISTEARDESQLTQSGTFLGTPAFSSPEQLRGDSIDLRSDIYSVGVTLYYVLTGKTAFDAENMVKLLAKVLEQPAPSPRDRRKEIPRGLARVVQRCLAKTPSARFSDYSALRSALLPFAPNSPTPATLSLRFIAGACDAGLLLLIEVALLTAGGSVYGTYVNREYANAATVTEFVFSVLLGVCYFAMWEGFSGASPGKALFRLKVVDTEGGQVSLRKAALRAAIYIGVPYIGFSASWVIGNYVTDLSSLRLIRALLYSLAPWNGYFLLSWALLFCTAIRRNGFASVYDLATITRVVARSRSGVRPKLEIESTPSTFAQEGETIGPYRVLQTLWTSEYEELLLAYDNQLLRHVWIRRLPDGSQPVSASRCAVSRAGRPRWLSGSRKKGISWDAYEASQGKSLIELAERPQPWSKVRFWLLDLAAELATSEQEGTLPDVLGLDRIWITGDGRAKLLDFPGPSNDVESVNANASLSPRLTDLTPRELLYDAAATALNGAATSVDSKNSLPAPLPVEAHRLLRGIPEDESIEDISDQLHRLTRKTPTVTRTRRLAMHSAAIVVPLLFLSGMLLDYSIPDRTLREDFKRLYYCLHQIELIEADNLAELRRDLEQVMDVEIDDSLLRLAAQSPR